MALIWEGFCVAPVFTIGLCGVIPLAPALAPDLASNQIFDNFQDNHGSPDKVRDFDDFLIFFGRANCEKIAVIKSAASAASAQGGCASTRLDHGLKFYVIRGGCASSRLISEFSDSGQVCKGNRIAS